MKRPWQIWLIFALCLATVLPAVVWLTRIALDLDRAESVARLQAEQEEAVGSALWQMDSELTRLLASEISRPPAFYRPFYAVDQGKGSPRRLPSPLLKQVPPLVRLHFELRPDDTWTSPQCPDPDDYELALRNDATPASIARGRRRLEYLSETISYQDLIAHVPDQKLHVLIASNEAQSPGPIAQDAPRQSQVLSNFWDDSTVQQQWSQQQAEMAQPTPHAVPQAAAPELNAGLQQRVQARRGIDLQSRNAAMQAATQQAFRDQRATWEQVISAEFMAEGVSRPVWVDRELLLVRRLELDGQDRIQGCWLDWPEIRRELLERIEPLLPEADLEPVVDMRQVRFTRVLATLPAQLIVPQPSVVVNPWSPIRISLIAVWIFFALATIAMAILLRGVVRLSERRAAFVSAVTHELRTPLTTFRMYAEMLLEGMVTDDQQRRAYLATLKAESDRLAHLVENVLQFARLERNTTRRQRESIGVGSLLDRLHSRLAERAQQADMQFVVEADEGARRVTLHTDPAGVEQILFNLVDNACKYAAGAQDSRIHLQACCANTHIRLQVLDHGPGIAPADRKRLFRPFSKSARDAAHSAPGVGLGLALCRRMAADLGGKLDVDNAPDNGAVFTLTLPV